MKLHSFLIYMALFLLVTIFGLDIALNHISLMEMSMTPNPKYFKDLSEISLSVVNTSARVAGGVLIFIGILRLLQKLSFKVTEIRSKN